MSAGTTQLEPDPRMRQLTILLLRVGLGINLLNTGVSGYITSRLSGMPTAIEALIPYPQIALGLALTLGFLTTPATIAVGLIVIAQPLVQTGLLFSFGMTMYTRGPMPFQAMSMFMASGSMDTLLVAAAVLWFSRPEHNPWSLDRVLFSPREPAPKPHKPPPQPREEPAPAPLPGSRTAAFISSRRESEGRDSTA